MTIALLHLRYDVLIERPPIYHLGHLPTLSVVSCKQVSLLISPHLLHKSVDMISMPVELDCQIQSGMGRHSAGCQEYLVIPC
jgi:hypothetical protein